MVLILLLLLHHKTVRNTPVSQWFTSHLPRIPSDGWAFRVRMTQRSGVKAWIRLGTDLGGHLGSLLYPDSLTLRALTQLKPWFIVVIVLKSSSFCDGKSWIWIAADANMEKLPPEKVLWRLALWRFIRKHTHTAFIYLSDYSISVKIWQSCQKNSKPLWGSISHETTTEPDGFSANSDFRLSQQGAFYFPYN